MVDLPSNVSHGKGKPPHRPAGKARLDEEHRRMNKMSQDDLPSGREQESEERKESRDAERGGFRRPR